MLRYTAGKLSVEYGEDHLLRIAFDGKLLLLSLIHISEPTRP